MKWFLGIFFGLISLGILGLDVDSTRHTGLVSAGHAVVWHESETSLTDINETGSRRPRSVTSLQLRQKSGRISDRIEMPGSLFFSCRIWQSYIPVDREKVLRLLFGYTIQVNAP